MRILRFVLLLIGLVLIGWGVVDYFSEIPEVAKQATAKVILGAFGILASFLAKNQH
ncbi:MAG: hypothetical protein JKY22_04340 [Flavobacteriaceae bacterium]|nr:hypothetical protein [Flavobacteriaceae bacterium]